MAEKQTWRAPRGMHDVLPERVPAWRRLERTAARLAELRGYREIRPVLVEETSLFTRSVGEVTDIVEKEMFTVLKGEHSFTLRPEGTAGIARAYLQAGWAKSAPIQRLFHVGPMFRYERPQKGRDRMFTQFDVECLGTLDPRADAEVIHLAASFFEELGIDGLEVRLNSMGDGEDRDRFRDAVREHVGARLAEYSEESQRRYERNVLRVLDSKAPQDIALNEGAPSILDYLSDESREHFEAVQGHLEDLGRKAVVDPGIVRGLDYYTRTVFEVHKPDFGARSALCGGGRYDHLLRDLGGPDLGAVGFAIGFSGTLIALEELGLLDADEEAVAPVYVVAADPACAAAVFALTEELRGVGVGAVFDYEGRGVKSQMKQAARGGHAFAAILGPTELERGVVQLKDLAAAEQREVARDAVAGELARALGLAGAPGIEPR
jgi:histidyl-tRNA synthetase